MYTLLIGLLFGVITGYLGFLIYPSYVLASLTFIAGVLLFNFFMGRYFMKKLTEVFNSIEKDIKAGKSRFRDCQKSRDKSSNRRIYSFYGCG